MQFRSICKLSNKYSRDILQLSPLKVRPVETSEEALFRELMQAHHYLGSLPKIGNTLWYFATVDTQRVALLGFSAAALKCFARDQWIGWGYRHQYDRLNLVANNSRFLILPGFHIKNRAPQILSLCRRRIQQDWIERFPYPLLVLETFVDPERYHCTIYRASNWILLVGIKVGAVTPKKSQHISR